MQGGQLEPDTGVGLDHRLDGFVEGARDDFGIGFDHHAPQFVVGDPRFHQKRDFGIALDIAHFLAGGVGGHAYGQVIVQSEPHGHRVGVASRPLGDQTHRASRLEKVPNFGVGESDLFTHGHARRLAWQGHDRRIAETSPEPD